MILNSNLMYKARLNNSGLTLIELIAVLAVAMILVAIAVPSVQNIKSKASSLSSISYLKNVFVSLNAYAGDNNGKVPNISSGDFSPNEIVNMMDSYSGNNSFIFLSQGDAKAIRKGRDGSRIPVYSYVWVFNTLSALHPQAAVDADLNYFPVCLPYNNIKGNNFILFASGRVSNKIK